MANISVTSDGFTEVSEVEFKILPYVVGEPFDSRYTGHECKQYVYEFTGRDEVETFAYVVEPEHENFRKFYMRDDLIIGLVGLVKKLFEERNLYKFFTLNVKHCKTLLEAKKLGDETLKRAGEIETR